MAEGCGEEGTSSFAIDAVRAVHRILLFTLRQLDGLNQSA